MNFLRWKKKVSFNGPTVYFGFITDNGWGIDIKIPGGWFVWLKQSWHLYFSPDATPNHPYCVNIIKRH